MVFKSKSNETKNLHWKPNSLIKVGIQIAWNNNNRKSKKTININFYFFSTEFMYKYVYEQICSLGPSRKTKLQLCWMKNTNKKFAQYIENIREQLELGPSSVIVSFKLKNINRK